MIQVAYGTLLTLVKNYPQSFFILKVTKIDRTVGQTQRVGLQRCYSLNIASHSTLSLVTIVSQKSQQKLGNLCFKAAAYDFFQQRASETHSAYVYPSHRPTKPFRKCSCSFPIHQTSHLQSKNTQKALTQLAQLSPLRPPPQFPFDIPCQSLRIYFPQNADGQYFTLYITQTHSSSLHSCFFCPFHNLLCLIQDFLEITLAFYIPWKCPCAVVSEPEAHQNNRSVLDAIQLPVLRSAP